MKQLTFAMVLSLLFLLTSCEERRKYEEVKDEAWKKRTLTTALQNNLERGKTYLSVYSQVYSGSEHMTHDLTAIISIRNTSETDSIFLSSTKYYNTNGNLVKNYFDKPVFLLPLETIEIVIDEVNAEGGTGANFIFDWQKDSITSEPLFESVMISTSGNQGLSLIVQGKRIE